MNFIALLFAVGLIFLAFEMLVPGVILGAMGGLALLAGVAAAFVQFGPGAGAAALAVALGLVGVLLYLEFAVMPKTKWGRRLFLKASISGTNQAVPKEAADLAGQTAEALTILAPSGYVSIGGQRYEAYSQSGHIGKGAQLRVVSADNFRIIVTKP